MHIHLRGHTFSLSEPFAPGHRLDAAEAAALNEMRAGQIKANMRRAVDLAVHQAPGGILSDSQHEILQKRVDFLSGLHSFRCQSDSDATNLRVEALRVAQERMEKRGPVPSEIGADLEDVIEALAAEPEIIEEARMRLAERARVAIRALEELA